MVAGGAGWFLGWGSEGIGRWVGSLWERRTACKCGVGFGRGLWVCHLVRCLCTAVGLPMDCGKLPHNCT